MLPHSAEAEQGVLGSLLVSPTADVVGACIESVTAESFHIPAHATVYETLIALHDKGVPIDMITLTQTLKDKKVLDQVGGPGFVADLYSFVPTAANVTYYLEIVREKHVLREIIKSCTECASRAYEDQGEVNGLLDEVEKSIFNIADKRRQKKESNIRDQVMEAIESIEKLFARKGAISGLSTGFGDLDAMTDGLHEAEMIVIAARPSMGKTAFALNIAEHVAVDLNRGVGVFSLEMSTQQLVQRLICSRAKISLKKIRDGFLAAHEFEPITRAASAFATSKLFIDDTAGLSILELRARARRMKAMHNIELIVIDYLQLLKSDSKKAKDNRQHEIAEISQGVKALAKELKLPIIVLAQLNRNPEQRTGGKPRLSDLRESGSIEQDADLVGLLVRTCVPMPRTTSNGRKPVTRRSSSSPSSVTARWAKSHCRS
ncbi:MAG: replicative DNA helicase [Chthoniobacteraceae bacterium]